LKSEKVAFADLFTGALDGALPKPVWPQMLYFYLAKFYQTRIKEQF
jgi:hypothetical protein